MNEHKFSVSKTIRRLAKDNRNQSLFSLAKEMKIELFENRTDFTEIQFLYLYYLSFYSSINLDIAIGDVNELVLEDEIYEDAYMHYKNKKKNKEEKRREDTPKAQTQWVFRNKK